jgi:uncharacterized protein YecE (DUF72 family)
MGLLMNLAHDALSRNLFVGVAGWSMSAQKAAELPRDGSQLERYAQRLNAVEINTSFYKPHRIETYIRWAASTPPGFRFAVKVPRSVSHDRRLVDCDQLLEGFATQVHGLGAKLGLILVQLPPTLVFEQHIAESFVAVLRMRFSTPVAIEPRHPSWFTTEINHWLRERRISRVAADPPIAPEGDEPGGCLDVRYYRWHGSPTMYFSEYEYAALIALQARLRGDAASGASAWCIFDNTGLGAALNNALTLQNLIA